MKPVMTTTPIAILTHWHTGSSLLSRTLHLCGMEIGNEKTSWIDNEQYEHLILNGLGVGIYHDKVSGVKLLECLTSFRNILRAYKREAQKNKWKFYGIKITHALQEKCWKHLGKIFEEEWPDAIYVISNRDVGDIYNGVKVNPEWDYEKVSQSLASTKAAEKKLLLKNNNGFLVRYPESYINGKIKEVVEEIGLKWNKEAEGLFKAKGHHV